jgi:hypothetical protein
VPPTLSLDAVIPIAGLELSLTGLLEQFDRNTSSVRSNNVPEGLISGIIYRIVCQGAIPTRGVKETDALVRIRVGRCRHAVA